MSKKNLARSTLEGGRSGFNRDERRRSNAVARRKARAVSRGLCCRIDPERSQYAPRLPVHRSFDDKLSPAFRWLESQVGRPWNKVQSELVQRFDTRTTAGRHILFCHLLPSIEPVPYASRFHPVYVDRHGMLRRSAPRPRGEKPEPWVAAEVIDWIGARRVGERDHALFSITPTDHGAFRQERRLSHAEAARFRALPEGFRRRLSPLARVEEA
jgi:hypothetical protein